MDTPTLDLSWGCRIGDQRHDREVIDSLGRGDDHVVRYLAKCRSCEHMVTVTAQQFAELGPCCRGRSRRAKP